MKFYLETNAIRKLSKNLNSVARPECFTSILALVELLSGIDSERQYNVRKTIISNVYESKIYVDFDSSVEKFLNSYGIPFKLDFELEYIKIVETLLESNSYQDFIKKADSNNKTVWDFIKKLDTELSLTLKRAFSGKFQELKESDDVKSVRSISEEWWSNFSISDIEKYTSDLMNRHASSISRTPELNPQNRSQDELINNYNGSIDTAILFEALYRDSKILWGGEVGRNDNADLAHLFYLNDLTTAIVTDDKPLTKLIRKLMPERVLSCNEFMAKTHSNS
ncbi:MAG: hypothetical protein RJQ14_02885 [Marinoscillum sp.]